jgi:hypothetical protein
MCLHIYTYVYVRMYESTYVGRHVGMYYARIFLSMCVYIYM